MPGDSPQIGRRGRKRGASADQRWRLTVRGRVQGVGYRAAYHRRASELGLGGWVRNHPDGSVELEAEGPPQQLSELEVWCRQGPQHAEVKGVSRTPVPPAGSDRFEILR